LEKGVTFPVFSPVKKGLMVSSQQAVQVEAVAAAAAGAAAPAAEVGASDHQMIFLSFRPVSVTQMMSS